MVKPIRILGLFLLFASCALGFASGRAMELDEFLSAQNYMTIPLQKLITGHEALVVAINGKEGLFILDSGAGASVLHSARLAKYSIQPEDRRRSSETAAGAGGSLALQEYILSSLSLGGVEFAILSLSVLDLSHVVDALAQAAGVEIDGVIGQDILTTYQGIIDVSTSRLFLKKTLSN